MPNICLLHVCLHFKLLTLLAYSAVTKLARAKVTQGHDKHYFMSNLNIQLKR